MRVDFSETPRDYLAKDYDGVLRALDPPRRRPARGRHRARGLGHVQELGLSRGVHRAVRVDLQPLGGRSRDAASGAARGLPPRLRVHHVGAERGLSLERSREDELGLAGHAARRPRARAAPGAGRGREASRRLRAGVLLPGRETPFTKTYRDPVRGARPGVDFAGLKSGASRFGSRARSADSSSSGRAEAPGRGRLRCYFLGGRGRAGRRRDRDRRRSRPPRACRDRPRARRSPPRRRRTRAGRWSVRRC